MLRTQKGYTRQEEETTLWYTHRKRKAEIRYYNQGKQEDAIQEKGMEG